MTKNALFKTLIKNLIRTHQNPAKAFTQTKQEITTDDKTQLEIIAKKFNIKDF